MRHFPRCLAVATVAMGAVLQGFAQSSSYELLLVADQGTKSVHRFDPITGAYFGSIGGGILAGALDIAANKSTGELLVHEGSGRVLRFNYSTGAYIGNWTIPQDVVDFHGAQNGDLIAVRPSGVVVYRPDRTERYTAQAPAGVSFICADIGANSGSGVLVAGASNSTVTSYNAVTGVQLGQQFWTTGRLAFSSNRALNRFGLYVESDYLSSSSMSYLTIGVASPVLTGVNQPSWGHGSLGYVAGKDATNSSRGLVLRYDYDYGVLRGAFGQNVLVDPRGTATILAPEPTTLVAACGGLAVLALRRRRRNN